MKDGLLRRVLKRIARACYAFDLRVTRWLRRERGGPRYRLAGACNGCGRCCETPVIPVSAPVFHVRTLRRLVLAWHRWVNGFEPVGEDRRMRLLVFRCTHYDPVSRQCDAYDSRPGMCRDYPRNLLDSPLPEFFPECGYRAVQRGAEGFREALARTDLPPEKLAELTRKLHLDE
ncbi:YkgJ family cysteine cluster protein [Corallococcus sp. M34]|uniref:YkgJ family cysteine cluster protein n=1 Tax=Citreicoccus inhibens TaxID=2849499 RepID=UPI001315AE0E|nr:YkgJ family cysteine cluster protein [Citreicoccus inhibens]MBU8897169.1 YkgJ family cysteine cluster protein [Citreicoccus inhibens]